MISVLSTFCRINLQTLLVINQRTAHVTLTCRRGDGLSDRLQISETGERSAGVWREQQHKALICDLYTLWPHTHTAQDLSPSFCHVCSDRLWQFKIIVIFCRTIPESVRNNKPTFTSSGYSDSPGVSLESVQSWSSESDLRLPLSQTNYTPSVKWIPTALCFSLSTENDFRALSLHQELNLWV